MFLFFVALIDNQAIVEKILFFGKKKNLNITIVTNGTTLDKYFNLLSTFKQLRNIVSILNGSKNVLPRFINCETNLLELLIFCPDGLIYTCPESIGIKQHATIFNVNVGEGDVDGGGADIKDSAEGFKILQKEKHIILD